MTVSFPNRILHMAGIGDFLKAAFLSWILGGGVILALVLHFLFFR